MKPVQTLSGDDLQALSAEVLARGGRLAIRATGHSMTPVIADGDRVVLGPAGPDRPRPGQIWLVSTAEGLRLHRLWAAGRDSQGEWFRVRGDAARGPGEQVRRADLLGRLVRVERPPGRYLSPRWWLRRLRRAWLLRSRMRPRPRPG